MSQTKLISLSILGGFIIDFVLTLIGVNIESKSISAIFLWQYHLFVRIIGPGPLLYTDEHGQPHYEGTPVLLLVWPVGFLVALPIYSALSYFFVRWIVLSRDRTAKPL